MEWISLILEPWSNRPLLSQMARPTSRRRSSSLHTRAPGCRARPLSRRSLSCRRLPVPAAAHAPAGPSAPRATASASSQARATSRWASRPRGEGACGVEHVMVGGAGCAGAWMAACPWRRRCGGRAACVGGGRNARHTFDRESCGECFSWLWRA